MPVPLEKVKKGGLWYYTPKKPIIMKSMKQFTVFPGIDEEGLLRKGRYYEASLQSAHRIEKYLKELYFYKYCPDLIAVYHEISELSFYKILNLCRASQLISKEEYDQIDLLRKARNEIAHHPYSKNEYIDSEKCKNVVRPCIDLINKFHSRLIEATKDFAENKKKKQ